MRVNGLYEQFRLVFEKYYNLLCKYANNFVKEESICEDIVQDVFVRIWETRRNLIDSDNIRFYLFVAVRNNCLTHLSREQKRAISSLSDMDPKDEETFTDLGTDTGDAVNYLHLLGQGVERLPPKCKEVFLLSRMGELSSHQVAESLGISVKTVNNQLWKALKLLREFATKAGGKLSFFL